MLGYSRSAISALTSAAVISLVAVSSAESPVLFFDGFDRPNSAEVGNGWGEDSFGSPNPDMVYISSNRLAIEKTPVGANRDGMAFRPFTQTCGVVVSGNVEWIEGNPYGAALIGLNGTPSWTPDGFHVQLRPLEFNQYHSGILFYNDTTTLFVPFTYDLSVRYNFEWSVRDDCSSDLRVWPVYQSRPGAPTASSPPVTLTNRTNPHLKIGGAGLGYPAYPDWQIRFDDIVVRANVTPVQIDIKPGSFPNSMNLTSDGATPVAILGSPTLDVLEIDVETLTLGTAGVKTVGKTDRVLCSLQDASGDFSTGPEGLPDGFLDLVCHFVTFNVVPEQGGTAAKVMGNFIVGGAFEGTDSVNIVP